MVSILGGTLVTLVAPLFIRMSTSPEDPPSTIILAVGAVALAFPISWGGYLFLSDPELESYRGTELFTRLGACALVYALLWGVWGFISYYLGLNMMGGIDDLPKLTFIVPAMLCIGAIAPFAALDFEYLTAAFHYGMYLAVTVLLRLIVNLPAF